MKSRLLTIFLLIAILMPALAMPRAALAAPTPVFVNELHYDNVGADEGEAIEVAGPAGTNLAGWSIALYNGSSSQLNVYNTINLSGVIPDQDSGFGTLDFFEAGIQNGAPDGFALVDSSNAVVQFLSYEGTFTAVDGPANGMTSTDIGVSESSSTPVGNSLQLSGTGAVYEDFSWNPDAPNTFGSVNTGQTFEGTPPENAPIIPNCDSPLLIIEGDSALHTVSASDADGVVTDIYLVSVDPDTPDISLSDITPADGVGGTATASVDVASSLDPGEYTVTVGFSNDDAEPQTAQCSLSVTVIQFLYIYEIQGSGRYSPFVGQVAATSGVVTLISANGRDMWIQDPVGDGDPQTSDGIFVDDRDRFPDPKPEVGDIVQVAGDVEELQFGNALPLTRIDDPHRFPFEIISSGNPLPAPVPLVDLPNEFMPDGELFWEPLEGMLVSVENGFVVAPTNGFGEFGMLTEADADADLGSGYYAQAKQILLREISQDPNVVDYNPERVFVDDASLDEPIIVMPGDRVRSFVGVGDYTFGMYKLQPVSFDIKYHDLPNLPASTRSGPNGDTVITTFNVENLFDLVLNTPAETDVIGQVGFDPGSEWGSGDTSTKDNTIRRKSVVCQGDTNPDDAFDPSIEWDGFAKDTFDGLGAHDATCTDAPALFISEYVEGSSYNKVLEIYNGTGAAVNLAASGYAVDIYFNGSSSVGRTINLSGTLAAGDVYVLAHSSAAQAIKDIADQLSGSVLFNGDDAVVLRIGGKDDAGSTPSPGELETQLTKLAMAIEVELQLPEIIVVQEVENTTILQVLGDMVNAAAGTDYMATSFETSDARGIEAGFLWDANRVALVEAFQMFGPGVEDWFGPGSPSAGREPIVGVFDIEGQEVTIIGNHFKSKGGDDPLYGVNWPAFRVTEIQRKGQARVVRDFANGILNDDPSALVMVTGDLNDFQFGEPGENEIGDEPGHPLSILEGGSGEVPLTNLLDFEKPAEVFTFVFDGNSQVLDHMLVSPALLDMFAAADILHFNAGFPSDLGEDTTTTLRASDHDPLEGRFKIK